MLPPTLRIALLHLAPRLGDLDHNRHLLTLATQIAADAGADWVISGELILTGYRFEPAIGTDWIAPQPDAWLSEYAHTAATLDVVTFVHTPERDALTGVYASSLLAFDRSGRCVGRHRKISVIPGAESWATAGTAVDVCVIDGVTVGMLVCADAFLEKPARLLQQAGADIIVSSAAWDPGDWGPAGEWERRSAETDLPLVVCNRTGPEPDCRFEEAVSAAVDHGERELSLTSASSAVFMIELQRDAATPRFRECERFAL